MAKPAASATRAAKTLATLATVATVAHVPAHPLAAPALASARRPRYLRLIPSLLVLTTAMAWGISSHPGVGATAARQASGLGEPVAAGVITTGGWARPLVTGLGGK